MADSPLPMWKSTDDLVEIASKEMRQPPPPPGGVPRQWLPGVVRWPIRLLFLPYVWIDQATKRVARLVVRPPYKQAGMCYQRGNCCHYILIPKPKGFFANLFFVYYTQVQGFFLRSKEPVTCEDEEMMVMGCRYLQKDGRCAHYRLRPVVCREWPMIEEFARPTILKGCGFRAEPRYEASSLSSESTGSD